MEHIDVSNQSLATQEAEIYRFVIRTTDLKDPVETDRQRQKETEREGERERRRECLNVSNEFVVLLLYVWLGVKIQLRVPGNSNRYKFVRFSLIYLSVKVITV